MHLISRPFFILTIACCLFSFSCSNSPAKEIKYNPKTIEEYDAMIEGLDKACDGTVCYYKKGYDNLNHFFFTITKGGAISQLYFNFQMPKLFHIIDIQLCKEEDCVSILNEVITRNYIPFPLKHLDRLFAEPYDCKVRFLSKQQDVVDMEINRADLRHMQLLSNEYKKIVNVK